MALKHPVVSLHPQLPLIAPNRVVLGLRHLYARLYSHRRPIHPSFRRAVQRFPPLRCACGGGGPYRQTERPALPFPPPYLSRVETHCPNAAITIPITIPITLPVNHTIPDVPCSFRGRLPCFLPPSFACGSLCPCSATGFRSYLHPA